MPAMHSACYDLLFSIRGWSEIVAEVEKGLRQGGLGIGFPVGYYTSVSGPEIDEVAQLAKRYSTFITAHSRYMAVAPPSGYLGIQEMLAIASSHDTPLVIHHVHSTSLELTRPSLRLIASARKQGLKVIAEFYPYTAGSSIMGSDYLAPGFPTRIGMDYSGITYLKTGETMTKELFEKYRAEDPRGAMIMRHIKEPDMLAAFMDKNVIVGSDGMRFTLEQGGIPAWNAAYGIGKGHPRGAGTHAKVLRMVREDNVVPLMQAVAKMSYLPAKFLEDMVPDMKLRGRLQPGAIADVTVFNPATVTDNADYGKGKNSLPSTGIPYVIVHGTLVVDGSKVLKDVYPGQPIRNEILD